MKRNNKTTKPVKPPSAYKSALKKKRKDNEKTAKELKETEQEFLQEKDIETARLPYSQAQIGNMIDRQSQAKQFGLKLQEGPYKVGYTQNGQYLGVVGQKGNTYLLEWKTQNLVNEFGIGDTVYDFSFCHTYQMFAACQEEFLYFYDHRGTQLHQLLKYQRPRHLTFLPYHFLMTVHSLGARSNSAAFDTFDINNSYIGNQELAFLDISLGQNVAAHKVNTISCMTHNPQNGVTVCGHTTGLITFWTPNMSTPCVVVNSRQGRLHDIVVTHDGSHVLSSGIDNQIKAFNLNTLKFDDNLAFRGKQMASALAISQTDKIALSFGKEIKIYDPLKNWELLLQHKLVQQGDELVNSMAFAPYEDYLGVGGMTHFESMVAPGTGRAQLDTFENNIYETRKTFREREVQQLLEKPPADTISMLNTFGGVERTMKPK